MYNHERKDAFDFGLSEITNYLFLYERNLEFRRSGIAKMRDYFYFNESLFTVTELIGSPIASINKNHLNLTTIKEVFNNKYLMNYELLLIRSSLKRLWLLSRFRRTGLLIAI